MMNVFHDFLRKFLEVFIDDFAVHGRADMHLEHLRLTLQRCKEVGLKLHPQKCFFGIREGILLGHKVSQKGIEVDQEKVAVWLAIKFPNSLKTLRGFLGCMNYYRRFIKDFSKIAQPLTKMLKRRTEVMWSEEAEASFCELKKRLAEAPILITPDWDKEFQVYVDVS